MHQETFEKCMLIRARKRDNRKTYRAGGTSGTIPPYFGQNYKQNLNISTTPLPTHTVSLIEVKVAVAVHVRDVTTGKILVQPGQWWAESIPPGRNRVMVSESGRTGRPCGYIPACIDPLLVKVLGKFEIKMADRTKTDTLTSI